MADPYAGPTGVPSPGPQPAYPPSRPPGYPPGYPQTYGGPPAGAPRNGMAVASLVLAVIGVLTCWSVVVGALLGIVAAVLGLLARGRARRGQAAGGGVAVAGVVVGLVALVLSAGFLTFYLWIAHVGRACGGEHQTGQQLSACVRSQLGTS